MTDFIHDTSRNLLIYRPGNAFLADSLLQAVPEAKQINGEYVAVPRSLRNSQLLRHWNYPVAPVVTDANYDWPRAPRITPYESQKLTSNFLVLHPRSFVLSDMGVGKTLATLWAADWLMRQHAPGTCRALIVAPLSILQRVWADAIFKNFLGSRTFEILHGGPEQRLKALARPADFFVINFDGVSVGAHTHKRLELDGFSKALAARKDIQIAIVDEASAYKEARTKRHRISRLVFGNKPYLWLLTGTPTPNKPTDAYGLAKLVNNAFGKSFTSFQQETMIQVSNFRWVPQKDGYEKARKLLSPSIRFEIEDVWDGPELTTQQREVALTPEQNKCMADLKRDLVVTIKSGAPITAVNEAASRQKFMQISAGAIYDSDHRVHLIDAKPRLEEIKAVIAEAPAKIIILAGLTSIVELLYRELKDYTRARVYGDTSEKERAVIFQSFQSEPDPRILIADPLCLAHGLDLWAARTVLWATPTDKAELYAQANKRAHRPGQKFPVTIVQLVSNPLEREIFRRLENNLSMQGALLDAVRNGEL